MARFMILQLLLLASSFVSNAAGASDSSLKFWFACRHPLKVYSSNAARLTNPQSSYTYTGSKAVKPVPTKSSTTTKQVDVTMIKTVVPKTTSTPAAVTQTSTKTSTTTTTIQVSGKTSTSTATTYTISTVSTKGPASTSITTSFAFATTTKKITTTIATPQGFKPVQSTIPGAMQKRDTIGAGQFVSRIVARSKQWASLFTVSRKSRAAKKTYPQKVECNIVVLDEHTVTVVQTQPTSTVQGPTPTSLATTTTVTTSTSTSMNADSTSTTSTVITLFVTSTSTPVKTSTATSTYTFTIQSATATVYAQCGPSNFATTLHGQNVSMAAPENSQEMTNNYQLAQYNASSAVDCCNTCAMNSMCEISVFSAAAAQAGQPSCGIILVGDTQTCSAPGQWIFNTTFAADSTINSVFSNGNCGVFETFQ